MTIKTKEYFSYEEYQEAAAYIHRKSNHQPKTALILGSGLGPLAEEIERADSIPYQEIPHFPHSSAPGHAGRLVIGNLVGKSVMVMQGRTHFYEGYTPQHITLPIRVMRLMGIETLIVTNAAGGINANFQAGDLMLITDHINMVGLAGNNPLRGSNLEEFGPRFPSMTHTYDLELIKLARGIALNLDLTIREGVYAYVAGPFFETPAEIRFLDVVGADAVGMSTVPEVTVAAHSGMRVLGISSITNMTIRETTSESEPSPEEVLEMGKIIGPNLMALLKEILVETD